MYLLPFVQTDRSALAYALEMEEDEISAMLYAYDETLFKDEVTLE